MAESARKPLSFKFKKSDLSIFMQDFTLSLVSAVVLQMMHFQMNTFLGFAVNIVCGIAVLHSAARLAIADNLKAEIQVKLANLRMSLRDSVIFLTLALIVSYLVLAVFGIGFYLGLNDPGAVGGVLRSLNLEMGRIFRFLDLTALLTALILAVRYFRLYIAYKAEVEQIKLAC